MTATISYDDVEVGSQLPAQTFQVQRLNLVQYCGASGDFNVIHWNERIATSVGLPNVIAHGMFTMATAVRVVTDWCGDPGAVLASGRGTLSSVSSSASGTSWTANSTPVSSASQRPSRRATASSTMSSNCCDLVR